MSEKTGPLMHQLVSAVNGLETESRKIAEETEKVFRSNDNDGGPFLGTVVETTTLIDGATLPETKAKYPVSSVEARVAYHLEKVTNAFDAAINREDANGMGLVKSELFIEGKSYGVHSANAYMCLRKQLISLSNLLAQAPSFEQGAYDWEPDPDRPNTFKRSEKKRRFKPTDQVIRVEGFPPDDVKAPTQKVTKDVHIGDIVNTFLCAKWTSTRKAEVLTRLGNLIKAVDKALFEANSSNVAQVAQNKLATDLLKDLLK